MRLRRERYSRCVASLLTLCFVFLCVCVCACARDCGCVCKFVCMLLERVCARWLTGCGVKLLLFRGWYFIRDITLNVPGYPLFIVSLHSSTPHSLHIYDPRHPSFLSHNHFLPCGKVVGFDKIPLRHSDQREHYTIQRFYFSVLITLFNCATF